MYSSRVTLYHATSLLSTQLYYTVPWLYLIPLQCNRVEYREQRSGMVECSRVKKSQVELSRAMVDCSRVKSGQGEPSRAMTQC